MSEFNYDRFIKLMLMSTSSHDGECLNAIRMANAEMSKLNVNWEQMIRGLVKVETRTASAPKPSAQTSHTKSGHHEEEHIPEWFDIAFATAREGSSFVAFLESLKEWYEEKGFLTEAQYRALEKSVAMSSAPSYKRKRGHRW